MAYTPVDENPFMFEDDFPPDKDFEWLDPGSSGGAGDLFDQFIALGGEHDVEGGADLEPSDSLLLGGQGLYSAAAEELLLHRQRDGGYDDGSTSLISPPASDGAAAGPCPGAIPAAATAAAAAANGAAHRGRPPPSTVVAQVAPPPPPPPPPQVHGRRDGVRAARVGPGPAGAETSEQRTAHITNGGAGRGGAAASMPDCELLQLEGLEGLNMGSPKVISSPVPNPPSPRSSVSPKKASRLENIYSTIRKAAKLPTRLRHSNNNPQLQQLQQLQQPQQPQSVPFPQTVTPAHVDSARKATQRLTSEAFAMHSAGGPSYIQTSPDHSPHHHDDDDDDNMEFVAGYVDDPFFEPSGRMLAAPGPRLSGASIPNTPLQTPHLGGGSKHGSVDLDAHGVPFGTSAPSSVGGWAMDHTSILAADGSFGDWSSVCMPDGLPPWWVQGGGGGGGDVDMASLASYHAAGAKNPPMNLPLQMQQQQQQYEYTHAPGGGGGVHDLTAAGGLMIHMPQPRTPGAAPVLGHDVAMGGHHPQYFAAPHPNDQQQQQQHHMMHQQEQAPPPPQQQPQPQGHHPPPPRAGGHYRHNSEHRRPKPRAPSSGARHHGAMTSPRKARQPSLSSSSPSPTPRGARRSTSMNSLSGGAAGGPQHPAAVRKRRSFQGTGSGGPAGAGSSSSHHPRTPSGSSSTGSIGFVNFTPSDSAVLMTGVAPSGSSKTKARREKEAADRQRKLSEAFMKAVSAAGGDVGKLKEEIMI